MVDNPGHPAGDFLQETQCFFTSIFQFLAPRDVLVGPQQSEHFVVPIPERDFGRAEPNRLASRSRLLFIIGKSGDARLHDGLVIGTIQLRPVCPSHLIVVFADHIPQMPHPGVLGKNPIAPEIAQVAILPENPCRYGVNDRQEQLSRLVIHLLHAFLLADVGVRDDHAGAAVASQRRDGHGEPALLRRRMAGVFQPETG